MSNFILRSSLKITVPAVARVFSALYNRRNPRPTLMGAKKTAGLFDPPFWCRKYFRYFLVFATSSVLAINSSGDCIWKPTIFSM